MSADFMNYLRFLATFFILSVCFSCKTKEVIKPNSQPSPFTVTATLADNGKDIILNWTKSKDPDGDAVTYAVVYKDTLAKNLSDTTYIIKDIPYGTEVKGSVVAKDLKGGATVATFNIKYSPNRPPNPFTVTATLADNGKDIILKWTKSKDPDGDAVTYAVVYKDTLAKNLSDTAYIIKDLPYDTEIKGSVVAKDLKGESVNSSFNIKTNEDPYVKIPDINFEKQLIANGIDNIQDGKVLKSNTERVTYLFIPSFSMDDKIRDLTGIESFSRLEYLNCSNQKLNKLDLSKNIALKRLDCDNSNLTSLDVSKNINLTFLFCAYNELSTLDISKNINLKYVGCYSNQLTNLDVKNNVALDSLNCSSNQLTNLDISKSNLSSLQCGDNKLVNLDISNSVALRFLFCPLNQLIELNISKNTTLSFLNCSSNKIQTICVNSLNQVKPDWQKDASATYKVCN